MTLSLFLDSLSAVLNGGKMTIFELAEIVNATLVMRKSDENSYLVHFDRGELLAGVILISATGYGRSPGGAMREYVQKIRDQRLVFDATGKTRREFRVPPTLVYKPWTRREASRFIIEGD